MMIRYRHVKRRPPTFFQARKAARARRERQELAELRKLCYMYGANFEVERRELARWKRENRFICWSCVVFIILILGILSQ